MAGLFFIFTIMKQIKLFLLGLVAMISQNIFCQEDSVVVTKFNEHYVEIQSLRFKLDSGYSESHTPATPGAYPSGTYTKISYRPQNRIILKDGIVLVKDRNNKPLHLSIYTDSILIQDNYFSSNGKLDYQDFDPHGKDNYFKNDCYIVLFWNNENNFDGIHYFFKNKKMRIRYNDDRTPSITIDPQ